MTAEVVVLNSSAVALAADSIATGPMSDGSSPKTHEVNKLFTLSKHAPVGAMVFGGATLVGIPWETVIKVYRKQLGNTSFPDVTSYAANFFDWIGSARLISEADQKTWFLRVAKSYLQSIDAEIDGAVKSYAQRAVQIRDADVERLTDEVINSRVQDLRGRDLRSRIPDGFDVMVRELVSADVEQLVVEAFGQKPLLPAHRTALADAVTMLVCRDIPFPDSVTSGVVIAGFGDTEMFPVVRCHHVSGVVCNRLVFSVDSESSFDGGPGAAVIPYAQKDVAETFLYGVNQDDVKAISAYLTQVFNRLPTLISENMAEDDERGDEIAAQLRSATESAVKDFHNRLFDWLHKRHIAPLIDTLRFLPKEGLAEIVESLVSLTSLKRKVSLGVETVGGPIDVAIISKGDGFIWTRRKHYFDPALNPAFFQNYLEK